MNSKRVIAHQLLHSTILKLLHLLLRFKTWKCKKNSKTEGNTIEETEHATSTCSTSSSSFQILLGMRCRAARFLVSWPYPIIGWPIFAVTWHVELLRTKTIYKNKLHEGQNQPKPRYHFEFLLELFQKSCICRIVTTPLTSRPLKLNFYNTHFCRQNEY
jgi:hypothetical protein